MPDHHPRPRGVGTVILIGVMAAWAWIAPLVNNHLNREERQADNDREALMICLGERQGRALLDTGDLVLAPHQQPESYDTLKNLLDVLGAESACARAIEAIDPPPTTATTERNSTP